MKSFRTFEERRTKEEKLRKWILNFPHFSSRTIKLHNMLAMMDPRKIPAHDVNILSHGARSTTSTNDSEAGCERCQH
jgi:hypothetical protein